MPAVSIEFERAKDRDNRMHVSSLLIDRIDLLKTLSEGEEAMIIDEAYCTGISVRRDPNAITVTHIGTLY